MNSIPDVSFFSRLFLSSNVTQKEMNTREIDVYLVRVYCLLLMFVVWGSRQSRYDLQSNVRLSSHTHFFRAVARCENVLVIALDAADK